MTTTRTPLGDRLRTAMFPNILGQEPVKRQLKSAILTARHVIIVGPPGIGKTTLVKDLASLLPSVVVADCGFHCLPGKPACPSCLSATASKTTRTITGEERFIRVQGSPDLTAEDLLGDIDPVKALQYGPLSVEAFTPGKIFKANNGILFFDEVNRCSEKLQNALLQVLEEGTVTIGSYDVNFSADIILVATMNPDDNSTEPLSDVFLDRFDVIRMGYPETQKIEEEIVQKKGQQLVVVPPTVRDAMVTYVRSLREDKRLEKVPSVRASLGLYDRAQANAFLAGHDEVTFEDLGAAIESVIAHRIRLKPSTQFVTTTEQFVKATYEQHLAHVQEKGGGL